MQNFCSLPNNHKCLVCEFPPCNCEKCTHLRVEGKSDQDDIKNCLMSVNDKNPIPNLSGPTENSSLKEKANETKKFVRGTISEIRKIPWPSLNLKPTSLESFLFDIVGIISFFIMGTFMFWITISQYLWNLIIIIIQGGRRPQLVSIILLLLLCVSITLHAFKGRHQGQSTIKSTAPLSQNISDTTQTPKCQHLKSCQRKRCSNLNLQNSKISLDCKSKESLLDQSLSSNKISSDPQKPTLCDLCAKKVQDQDKSQHILSDDEFREMYKKYKLYTIPSEMKTPPSINRLLEFVVGLYNTVQGSLAR
ncbi:uncharacterized protein ACRADG_006885 [Cochliomyia hominivorax]